MARNRSVLNTIMAIVHDHTPPPFAVEGFEVILDDPSLSLFDPYCWESASEAGFVWHFGMPSEAGFFYLSNEYEAYLALLTETATEHPANSQSLPWVQRYSEPITVEVVEALTLPPSVQS